MTETGPQSEDRPPPTTRKGVGCFYGGLATLGAIIGAGLLVGLVVAAVGGRATATDVLAGILVFAIPVAALIAVGFLGKRTPGFLLGMGLTIGLGLALFTGCLAVLAASTA